MNASSKLFADFENNTGYLKRPGETLALLQNMAIFLRQQEHDFEEVVSQQYQSNNTRYLQQVPDRFPEQGQSPRNSMSNRDSETDPDYYRQQQQQQQQQYENDQEYHYYNQDQENATEEPKNPERMTLAEILWSSHRFQTPSNQEILRELPYVLQGISGSIFTWVEPLPPDENSARPSRSSSRARTIPSARNAMRYRNGFDGDTEPTGSRQNEEGEDVEEDDEQTTTVLTLPIGLAWPMHGILNKLMEPAVLYRNIVDMMKKQEGNPAKASTRGLVVQALNSAIDHELRGYLALVGVIETEVRRQEMNMQNQLHQQNSQRPEPNLQFSQHNRNSGESTQPSTSAGLPPEAYAYGVGGKITLTRCIVLLQEATQGLRLIYSILKESESLVGGQLLSLIHSYTYNGDQFISKFATRILPKVTKPFFDILNKWVVSGQLVDPHREFFVKNERDTGFPGHPGTSGVSTHSAGSLWERTFVSEYKYLPDYIPKTVCEQIFQIGKTLHFIATACDDREWVDRRKPEAKLDPSVLYNPDLLQKQVSVAYKQVVRHLNDILRTKFHLGAHLRGLKDYLLLGKGDFVQLLVESVAPVLDRPATHLFRHHLTATLETAVRGSNALLDHPDVLKALDARMLELGHGDIGWDVFTLDYRVDKPLDTVILDRRFMTEYLKVFNFLWRIKRMSFTLNTTWRQLSAAERGATSTAYLRNPSTTAQIPSKPQYPSGNVALGNGAGSLRYHATVYDLYPQPVRETWRLVRQICGEMLHFISELEYYINYEVIEMAWDELNNKIQNGELSVDELIAVHQEYLRKITYKGLLGGGDLLIGELHDILKTILAFGITTEGLHDLTKRLRVSETTTPGLSNSVLDEATSSNSALAKRAKKISHTIQELKHKFEQSVRLLVTALDKEEDGEMRFLSVRLDFNGFYSRLNDLSKPGPDTPEAPDTDRAGAQGAENNEETEHEDGGGSGYEPGEADSSLPAFSDPHAGLAKTRNVSGMSATGLDRTSSHRRSMLDQNFYMEN